MIRIVVLHMCIDFIFQNFGQKVVEIISTVLKSCLSKVSFLLFRQKKNLDIKINKDTRRAWDCWIMYCLYNVLLNGFMSPYSGEYYRGPASFFGQYVSWSTHRYKGRHSDSSVGVLLQEDGGYIIVKHVNLCNNKFNNLVCVKLLK